MTEYLDAKGYEQTKTKLADLERRQSEVVGRTDLSSAHREQVLRSYREMVQQYRREIKLYEAMHEHAARDA